MKFRIYRNIYFIGVMSLGIVSIMIMMLTGDLIFVSSLRILNKEDELSHLIAVQSFLLVDLVLGFFSDVFLLLGVQMQNRRLVTLAVTLFFGTHFMGSFPLGYHVQYREKENIPFFIGKQSSRLIYSLLVLSVHTKVVLAFDWYLEYSWNLKLWGFGNPDKIRSNGIFPFLFITQGMITLFMFAFKFVRIMFAFLTEEGPSRKKGMVISSIFIIPGLIIMMLMARDLVQKLNYMRLRRFKKYYLFWMFACFIFNPVREGVFGEYVDLSMEIGNICRIIDLLLWLFSLSCYTVTFLLMMTKEEALKPEEVQMKRKRSIPYLPADNVEVFEDIPIGSGNSSLVYKGVYHCHTSTLTKLGTLTRMGPYYSHTPTLNKFGTMKRKNSGTAIPVAVKVVSLSDNATPKAILLEELQNMGRVMGIGENCRFVKFFGACFLKGAKDAECGTLRKVYIVMELCDNGTLLDNLRKISKMYAENVSDNILRQLQIWGMEIAEGMRHLTTLKLVHGDLAARNILLGSNLEAKISDFGMSCKLYGYETYATNQHMVFPWRWMAPESLDTLKFSVESDVWSYGVLLWEIFSLGKTPYEDLEWTSTFTRNLMNGCRLARPVCASEHEYRLMKECWELLPSKRPSFEKLFILIKCL